MDARCRTTVFFLGAAMLVACSAMDPGAHDAVNEKYISSTAMFCRDATATGTNGHIYSHEYPQNYTHNEDCSITVETGDNQLHVYVVDFITEDVNDFLTITDNNGIFTYSGEGGMTPGTNYTYDAKAGNVEMRFQSNSVVNNRGFSMEYTVIPYPTTMAPAPTPGPGDSAGCPDVTGIWDSTTDAGAAMELTQAADRSLTGLYQDSANPVYVAVDGFNGRVDGGSPTVCFTFYGDESALSMTGFCKVCSGAMRMELYKTTVQEPDLACGGVPVLDAKPSVSVFVPRA